MKVRILFLFVISVLVTGSALGQADKLQDLVGSRGSSGESAMRQRGYVMKRAEPEGDKVYSYWWNRTQRKCVLVNTTDGRYAIIVDSTPDECNGPSGGGNQNAGNQAGGADKLQDLVGSRGSSGESAMRQRGYVMKRAEPEGDKVYSYWWNRTQRKCVLVNTTDGRYAIIVDSTPDECNGPSGGGRPVNLDDLKGMRASSGEAELGNRGFVNVDGYKRGGSSYTIWWNSNTRQCVAVSTYQGKYNWLGNTKNNNCR